VAVDGESDSEPLEVDTAALLSILSNEDVQAIMTEIRDEALPVRVIADDGLSPTGLAGGGGHTAVDDVV